MIRSDNMTKVTARSLQDIRIRYQVPSMWGTISPNWDLLQQHLSYSLQGGASTRNQEKEAGRRNAGVGSGLGRASLTICC